jgi:hypothetical protein
MPAGLERKITAVHRAAGGYQCVETTELKKWKTANMSKTAGFLKPAPCGPAWACPLKSKKCFTMKKALSST